MSLLIRIGLPLFAQWWSWLLCGDNWSSRKGDQLAHFEEAFGRFPEQVFGLRAQFVGNWLSTTCASVAREYNLTGHIGATAQVEVAQP